MKNKQVLIKASEEEASRWKESASREGMTLSAWIRDRLNGRSDEDSSPSAVDEIEADVPVIVKRTRCERCVRCFGSESEERLLNCRECGLLAGDLG